MRELVIVVIVWLIASQGNAATFDCKWIGWAPNAVLRCELPAAPPVAKASFCDVMARAVGGPFLWSSQDTRGTKEQADKINAAGKALCNW